MDVVELAYVLRLDEVDVRERGESKKMRELEGEGTGSGSAAPHRKGRELLTSYATSRTRCTDMLAGLKSSRVCKSVHASVSFRGIGEPRVYVSCTKPPKIRISFLSNRRKGGERKERKRQKVKEGINSELSLVCLFSIVWTYRYGQSELTRESSEKLGRNRISPRTNGVEHNAYGAERFDWPDSKCPPMNWHGRQDLPTIWIGLRAR